MTAPVHVVGGIAITGVFGAFMDINILEKPTYLMTIVVASMLPDVDHTKSPIGTLLYPLARLISRRYGHRTITHTLVATILLTTIAAGLSHQLTGTGVYGSIFFLAYFSHLILDMLTVMGIPLFYPFSKQPCFMPGDPKLRFESGNLRTETMAFFFFLAMGVFLQPLMETGFWTQYNQAFGTMKHLHSEFRKSEDLLDVEYIGHKGSDRVGGKGYVIEAEKEKAILIRNHKFFVLDAKDFVIEKVVPTHTGKKYFYQNQTFINVDLDSLNVLCLDHLVSKIEVHANNPFIPWADDLTETATKKYQGEYISNLFFEEMEIEPTTLATYRHVTNPRIKLLRDKLRRLENLQAASKDKRERRQTKLKGLRGKARSETDYLKRESLLAELKRQESAPKEEDYSDQIESAKIQLKETIELDRLKRQEGNLVAAEKNRVGDRQNQPTRFTGFLTTLKIEE